MSTPQNSDYVADAAAAYQQAVEKSDEKMKEDVMHAFDRNTDINRANRDMRRS